MLEVKFKKLHPDAKAPYHGSAFAAGFDLFAVSKEIDNMNEVAIYHTGLAFEIPQGYVGLLFPRSSVYMMHQRSSLSVGVIDADYRGEVRIIFDRRKLYDCETQYQEGDRVGQLVIVPIPDVQYVEADTLSETERGTGGYGSTGGFTTR